MKDIKNKLKSLVEKNENKTGNRKIENYYTNYYNNCYKCYLEWQAKRKLRK